MKRRIAGGPPSRCRVEADPAVQQEVEGAEFFSFGTNDLTQTALGISRDDMGAFLMPCIESEVFAKNPFATLDATGVGQLMQTAVTKGRSTRPNIKLGICQRHEK